jgi:alpha-tubulin suppressor-like RCC1 family protein
MDKLYGILSDDIVLNDNYYDMILKELQYNTSNFLPLNSYDKIQFIACCFKYYIVYFDTTLFFIDKKTYEYRILMNNIDIKNVSCGKYHSFFYTFDNELFCLGANMHGQLGLGTITYHSIPSLSMMDRDVKMIACGDFHTMMYLTDGSLLTSGFNSSGQLGLDHTFDIWLPTLCLIDLNIKQISCGCMHSMILSENSI